MEQAGISMIVQRISFAGKSGWMGCTDYRILMMHNSLEKRTMDSGEGVKRDVYDSSRSLSCPIVDKSVAHVAYDSARVSILKLCGDEEVRKLDRDAI
jgi:hypothetical protein